MKGRPRTVRVRVTLASTAIVAGALTVAGVMLVNVLRTSQINSVDTALELRTADIESFIAASDGLTTLSVEDDEDGFAQIVDLSGTVLASSGNVEGEPSFVTTLADVTLSMRVASLDTEEFRVHVHRTGGDEPVFIIVGTNLENVARLLRTVWGALIIGLPLLVLLMGGMIWSVIGRALRPVEAIRSEVADIGGGDLHRRVPEPATHDEIGRLAVTMNAMLDRLEASNVAQARFVSDASHELRTPIAVIRHELEVALRSDDDTLLREVAGEVLDEDLRMQRLVEDLLFLARREGRSGAAAERRRALVDLDDIALTEAHRVHTTHTIDTSHISAGQVRGDADQLGRVVRNLLDNALRHARSRVQVSVSSEHGEVVLHVDDDGDGVAEHDRERIFERFGRADESRARDVGGSGLGLAIVAGLVEEHGARVDVGASPLGGARFTVTLTDARS